MSLSVKLYNSGAMYSNVPLIDPIATDFLLARSMVLDVPKSASLTVGRSFFPVNNIFSGFKSLCVTLFGLQLCRC